MVRRFVRIREFTTRKPSNRTNLFCAVDYWVISTQQDTLNGSLPVATTPTCRNCSRFSLRSHCRPQDTGRADSRLFVVDNKRFYHSLYFFGCLGSSTPCCVSGAADSPSVTKLLSLSLAAICLFPFPRHIPPQRDSPHPRW